MSPAETAWVALVPCGLLTLAAVVLLGPPLGRILFPPGRYGFWPEYLQFVSPEPTEHAAYLLALAGAIALPAAVLAGTRWQPPLTPSARRWLAHAGQAGLVGFLLLALVAQRLVRYDGRYGFEAPQHAAYFTPLTLLLALLVAAAIPFALHSPALRPRLAGLLRETRARRIAAVVVAVAITAIWLLTALNLDRSVGHVNRAVFDMLPWSMDETWAILNGRTPLVDFHAQYGQLWPYLVAGAMALVGPGLGVYTSLMAAIGGASMLAVFALLRRVTRSSLAALALFLPLLATSYFMEDGPLGNRYGPSNLLTIFPVRYAGPFLLAWLVARHLDGSRPTRTWPLFAFGGLVVLNNPEFGLPAFGATLAACVWTRPPRSAGAAARLLGSAAAGLLGAVAAVTLLTLLRSGSAPQFGLLVEFARLYGVSGWAMLPMPALGFHLALFATFVAALTLATVRAVAGDEDVPMTGLLAWSGIFGLGAGAYFVGRSHPDVLVNLFAAWALALVLLVVVVVRALAARPSGRPQLAELAVLLGLGLAVCSLAQTPTPWAQLQRLTDDTPVPALRDNAETHFIARNTAPGESVVLLTPAGHRTAYDLGLVDVSPYATSELVTRGQLADTIAALRAAHGRRMFVALGNTGNDVLHALTAAGFVAAQVDRHSATAELIDQASP
jgi:hypothetical protein